MSENNFLRLVGILKKTNGRYIIGISYSSPSKTILLFIHFQTFLIQEDILNNFLY